MAKSKKNKAKTKKKEDIEAISKAYRFMIGSLVTSIIFASIFVILTYWYGLNLSCYEANKHECLNCHSLNKTFSLCEDEPFVRYECIEPKEFHVSSKCTFHPSENCSKVPKRCIV